jgi:2-(1,2-epoxy-1,2-dihydrophenyl)acetyl-CoA isomerase
MATIESHLQVDIADGVALLTLNRPEKLNALSDEMIREAIATLERCATDPAVAVVLLTGAGRGFCAGGDVGRMAEPGRPELTFEQRVDRQREAHRLPLLIHSLPKVTIAAINGPAAGAGLGLALACDLRIASEHARLTTAFSKVGFGGDFGITFPLARLTGEAKAKELLFLSDVVSAQEALRIGLVNRVVPHESLFDEATKLAARVAAGPLVSYRYMKENVHLASSQSYEALLDREALTHLRCGDTADHREGVRAFVEKRPPKFQGR